MTEAYFYLALSGALTALLWTPYTVARLFTWGLGSFLKNYTGDFPQEAPEHPLWAARAQRAHLNMVEKMPAFIAAVVRDPGDRVSDARTNLGRHGFRDRIVVAFPPQALTPIGSAAILIVYNCTQSISSREGAPCHRKPMTSSC